LLVQKVSMYYNPRVNFDDVSIDTGA